MAFHPRARRCGGARRRPVRSRAPVVRARRRSQPGGPALLAACGGDDDDGGASRRAAVKLSRPDNPATLPTFDDIAGDRRRAAASRSGTLKVFNYEEYISPDVLTAFEEEYGVNGRGHDVHQHGRGDRQAVVRARPQFDVFFPTPDVIGKVVAGKLLQPLNKTLHPEPRRTCGSRCRIRSTTRAASTRCRTRCYTTGIGYRIDAVAKTPDALRQPVRHLLGPRQHRPGVPPRGRPRGVRHGAAAHAATTDVNTEDAELIDAALADVTRAHRPRQRQGRGRGLHGAAREARRGCTRLVRRRRQRPVLPARGRDDRQHRLLVPARRRRRDRQRHDRRHARRRAARCSPTRSSTTCSTRRTPSRTTAGSATSRRRTSLDPDTRRRRRVRPRAPRHRRSSARGLRHAASSCSSCRSPARRSGTTPGRRSPPVPDIATLAVADRRGGCGRRSPRPACSGWSLLFVVPFYGVLAVAFGRRRPDLRQRRARVEPARLGLHAVRRDPRAGLRRRARPVFIRTLVYVGAGPDDLLPDRLPGRLLRRPPRRAAAAACCSPCSSRRSGSTT